MAGEIITTLVGNLTADPELRFTQSGRAVANLTLACTPRKYDQNTQEWKDGDTTFVRVSVWGDHAEHAAESLRRGDRAVAIGRLTNRPYENNEGEKRYSLELDADELAASVRYRDVRIIRPARKSDEERDAAKHATKEPALAGTSTSATAEPPF